MIASLVSVQNQIGVGTNPVLDAMIAKLEFMGTINVQPKIDMSSIDAAIVKVGLLNLVFGSGKFPGAPATSPSAPGAPSGGRSFSGVAKGGIFNSVGVQ